MGYRDYQTGIGGTCRDCEDRYPACHDSCEKYRKASADWQKRKDKIRKAKKEAQMYDEYKINKIKRERK